MLLFVHSWAIGSTSWISTGLHSQGHGRRLQFCTDTCQYPADGLCDDGGPGSTYGDCAPGTDCSD
eukprot:4062350-Prymnesium_polylepis.1